MMKTRQPAASNIAPLVIRKVNRGMKPMSIVLEQVDGHDEDLHLDANSGDDRDKRQLSVLNVSHAAGKTQARIPNVDTANVLSSGENNNDVFKRLHEEGNEIHKMKQQSLSVIDQRNASASTASQQKISRLPLINNEVKSIYIFLQFPS